MKALTICQPYAHLIVRGEKRVENREWPTRYRGPLAIHAGKNRAWTDADEIGYYARVGDPMEFGAIVGLARLVDVLHIARIERGDYDQRFPWLRKHRHTEGSWCWVLGDMRRIAPVPASGKQGLWEIEDSLLPLAGVTCNALFGKERQMLKHCPPPCTSGKYCQEEVQCTPETCPYGQKGWRHTAECIKHICAHDFRSGPWIELSNGGTASCACGMTADSHDMRYAP